MTRLVWRTAGESHGAALVGVLEGLPAGLTLSIERVDRELARRQGGHGRGGRMKIERDRVELLSGTKGGVTIGSPVSFLIKNQDAVLEQLPIPTNPRPGHADLAGCQKWGIRDPRAVLERASARETAARVALGALARQALEAFGIEIFAHVVALGGVELGPEVHARALRGPSDERFRLRAGSDFYSLAPERDGELRARVDAAKADQDSLGGVLEVLAFGLPPGLGSCASGPERLTARLGGALFSIPAIKAVEFGLGFGVAGLVGSAVHDPIIPAGKGIPVGMGTSAREGVPAGEDAPGGVPSRYARASNNAGGLEGGMTTGEPLVVRAAMKPIPSLRKGLPSVDFASGAAVRATYQRSDVTSVPAASVVAEALVALTLAEAFLEKYGGDSLAQVRAAYAHHVAELRDL